jgi:hypothetical protein
LSHFRKGWQEPRNVIKSTLKALPRHVKVIELVAEEQKLTAQEMESVCWDYDFESLDADEEETAVIGEIFQRRNLTCFSTVNYFLSALNNFSY